MQQMIRHHGEEIRKLKEQLRQLQTEIEKMQQMIRVQTEEQSYINKVCADMVKLTNKIPEKTKFGDLTIPAAESATINTLRQTLELTLNRLVEVNNNQIITNQQLKEKIHSVAKWTNEQRNASEQERNVLLNALKEQKSKTSQCENELQKRSDKLNELQTSNFDLQKEIERLGHENGSLRARVENVQDIEALRHSIQSFKLQLIERERYILTLEKEKDDLHTRLSSVAGDRLTKGNPEITDLGDPYRPMKISDMYGELYDNEWTDAMECTDDIKKLFKDLKVAEIEEIVVRHLYKLLKCCYVECLLLSQEQLHIIRTTIKNTLHLENQDDPVLYSIISCKDISTLRRKNGDKYALVLLQNQVLADKIIESITSSWDYIHKNENLMRQLTMTSFFQKCVQLCWLMAIQDPVLYLSDEMMPDTLFDKNVYKEYVSSGDKVRYAVWPALFLHKNGPILFKGVVQAYS